MRRSVSRTWRAFCDGDSRDVAFTLNGSGFTRGSNSTSISPIQSIITIHNTKRSLRESLEFYGFNVMHWFRCTVIVSLRETQITTLERRKENPNQNFDMFGPCTAQAAFIRIKFISNWNIKKKKNIYELHPLICLKLIINYRRLNIQYKIIKQSVFFIYVFSTFLLQHKSIEK